MSDKDIVPVATAIKNVITTIKNGYDEDSNTYGARNVEYGLSLLGELRSRMELGLDSVQNIKALEVALAEAHADREDLAERHESLHLACEGAEKDRFRRIQEVHDLRDRLRESVSEREDIQRQLTAARDRLRAMEEDPSGSFRVECATVRLARAAPVRLQRRDLREYLGVPRNASLYVEIESDPLGEDVAPCVFCNAKDRAEIGCPRHDSMCG